MDRGFCVEVKGKKARAILQKSVEQVIKKNKEVFDNLAKD